MAHGFVPAARIDEHVAGVSRSGDRLYVGVGRRLHAYRVIEGPEGGRGLESSGVPLRFESSIRRVVSGADVVIVEVADGTLWSVDGERMGDRDARAPTTGPVPIARRLPELPAPEAHAVVVVGPDRTVIVARADRWYRIDLPRDAHPTVRDAVDAGGSITGLVLEGDRVVATVADRPPQEQAGPSSGGAEASTRVIAWDLTSPGEGPPRRRPAEHVSDGLLTAVALWGGRLFARDDRGLLVRLEPRGGVWLETRTDVFVGAVNIQDAGTLFTLDPRFDPRGRHIVLARLEIDADRIALTTLATIGGSDVRALAAEAGMVWLAAGTGGLQAWRLGGPSRAQVMPLGPAELAPAIVRDLTFHDGRLVVANGQGVSVWDVTDPARPRFRDNYGLRATVTAVATSPVGLLVASHRSREPGDPGGDADPSWTALLDVLRLEAQGGPKHVRRLTFNGQPKAIAVADGVAWILHAHGGITGVALGDGEDARIVGQRTEPEASYDAIEVVGRTLAVGYRQVLRSPGGKRVGIATYDITDPSTIRPQQRREAVVDAAIPFLDNRTIGLGTVSGHVVFYSVHGLEILALDAATGDLRDVGALDLPPPRAGIRRTEPAGIRMVGPRALVAVGEAGLFDIDLGRPDLPDQHGLWRDPALPAHAVAAHGSLVALASAQKGVQFLHWLPRPIKARAWLPRVVSGD